MSFKAKLQIRGKCQIERTFLNQASFLWSTIQFVLDMVLDMVPVMVRLQHALSLPSLPYLLQLC